MTIHRVLLIVNPAARRASLRRGQAVAAFQRRGIICDVRETTAPGHAGELARAEASGYDAVFTLGGDGTAIEVTAALADSGPVVGVLPGGTANILARGFGIPMNIERAVDALVNGRETRIDLGRTADGAHFAIGLGVGVAESMIAGASTEAKLRAGTLAYIWSATWAALGGKGFRYRLTADDQVHEGRAISILIANPGSVLGTLLTLGNDIRMDDGVMNAVIFSPRTMLDSFRIFARMLTGSVARDPCMSYVAGRQFRLETTPVRRSQADGELVGDTPIDVTVRAGAARLLIPS